jgi:hypothetical protein
MKNTSPLKAPQAETRSRLLAQEPTELAGTRAVCESCHWSVLAARRFRGRTLCVACIEEHFAEETDE